MLLFCFDGRMCATHLRDANRLVFHGLRARDPPMLSSTNFFTRQKIRQVCPNLWTVLSLDDPHGAAKGSRLRSSRRCGSPPSCRPDRTTANQSLLQETSTGYSAWLHKFFLNTRLSDVWVDVYLCSRATIDGYPRLPDNLFSCMCAHAHGCTSNFFTHFVLQNPLHLRH